MSAYQFKCRECGCEFDEPRVYSESHGFTDGLYEHWHVCPRCDSPDYGDSYQVEQEEACLAESEDEDD